MTCGAGVAIMVVISTAVSVATQGIQDAIKGEFLGLYARRLEKEQKARNNCNKRKKRGGPKMSGVLYFLLLHELIRRY